MYELIYGMVDDIKNIILIIIIICRKFEVVLIGFFYKLREQNIKIKRNWKNVFNNNIGIVYYTGPTT